MSCVELAHLHHTGATGDPDQRVERAAQLFEEACQLDDQGLACFEFAKFLIDGPEKFSDRERAEELLAHSCDNDQGPACLRIAQSYYNDDSLHKAYASYERACDLGELQGCIQLGNLYRYGEGVDEDATEASAHYRRACETGKLRGCKLGQRFGEQRRGDDEASKQPTSPQPVQCGADEAFGGITRLDPEQWESRVGADITELRDLDTSQESPVEVCMPEGQREYIIDLHCADGSAPRNFHRQGSVGSGGRCDNVIDLYSVECPEKTYEIFMDMYFCPAR